MRVHSISLKYLAEDGGPTFLHNRRQMPVGQGGLHIGALKLFSSGDLEYVEPGFFGFATGIRAFGRADLRYVYDCGSEPKRLVNSGVKELRNACPDRRLDMLFLSHFDRDHMNGIPALLHKTKGFQVDTIVLPYLDTAARVAALARAFAQSGTFGGSVDRFFIDMIFDPGGTLAQFRPRQILFIRSDGGDVPPDVDGGPEIRPGSGPEVRAERDTEAINWLIKPAFPGDPQRPLLLNMMAQAASSSRIEVRNAAIVAHDPSWSLLWKFLPYVRTPDPAALATFCTLVEGLFKWPAGSFAFHIGDTGVRQKMVTKFREKMGAIYKSAFKDKNLGSMSLYSGLMEPDTVDALAHSPQLPTHDLTKIGWMGTGDAHLEKPVERGAFTSFYGSDIDHVAGFALPHHGAIKNSDPVNLVGDADTYIAAADPIHDWEHPHWSLRKAVYDRGSSFRHVRAWPATGFDESFIISPK
ncbi:hypothetical protein TPR58_14315 [Sphingomonas sp. HF-S3]|uniref:Metallo-beta-lactamase domain-containing protein n=1 Tax=Sphingomonas rustica TaxID=3103142 RepID=A0ABV0BE33_9SPHN